MTSYRTKTEAQAEEILRLLNALRAPVPIETVARGLGLQVQAASLGDEISGVLVVQNGKGVIGYNADQAPVRQRFSIAHEVAHFVLHQSMQELFIDKSYTAVFRRDQRSSTGEHRIEIEANQFAAVLLMPKTILFKELRQIDFDLADECALDTLADRFKVSAQAMSIRLGQLGAFPRFGRE